MPIEIKAPMFPESVADGEVATWHKNVGDQVARDELIVEIETDKVVMEVVAPEDGVITAIHANAGETIHSEQLLATLEQGAAAGRASGGASAAASAATDSTATDGGATATATTATAAPATATAATATAADAKSTTAQPADKSAADTRIGPAARQLVDEHGLDAAAIRGTGRHGVVTKEDVVRHLKERDAQAAPAPAAAKGGDTEEPLGPSSERVERRVPMTRIRAKIAERLLNATQQTAMLSTFNEVNMAPLMALRSKYRDQFEKTHNGTRLGFMGFFVKAACEALKRFPAVNASIDGNDVVYHGYQDIGVAVSTENGLVVPVLRDADFMSIADVEAAIADMAKRARDNKLTIADMTGGTFTVTNGGVYGSLLSTPILNPPQTGILGMHKIQERPMAVDGQVVILPMMYLALSYDHRLIDGKTAVQFLVAIKDLIEDPARILLQL